MFLVCLSVLLRPAFPLVEYAVNYDYIANVLCENKAKPEMHCNGKCHLMKELAKAADSEKPASQDHKRAAVEFDLFASESICSVPNPVLTVPSVRTIGHRTVLFVEADQASVFHPPTSA